jgi:chromosome segregation ATPase
MIKNFTQYNLSEQSEYDQEYVDKLLDKISDLEDRVDELEDDIKDLENTIEKKDEQIYGLDDSYSKLEKENSKFEDEIESLNKQEQKLIDEKQDLEAQLKIYIESYSIFDKGTDDEKMKVIEAFLDMLDIMEDRPLEFGGMLRKEMKKRPRFERLINAMLDKEWVDTYTGSGSGLLGRIGISD